MTPYSSPWTSKASMLTLPQCWDRGLWSTGLSHVPHTSYGGGVAGETRYITLLSCIARHLPVLFRHCRHPRHPIVLPAVPRRTGWRLHCPDCFWSSYVSWAGTTLPVVQLPSPPIFFIISFFSLNQEQEQYTQALLWGSKEFGGQKCGVKNLRGQQFWGWTTFWGKQMFGVNQNLGS